MGAFGEFAADRVGTFQHGALDPRRAGMRYPSPWWDLAQMSLPNSVKDLFKQVAYHATFNPLITSAVRKLAAYPITKVVVEASGDPGFDKHVQRWEDLFHRCIDIQKTQVELGIDYYTFGNAFASVYLPFVKMLRCSGCKADTRIDRLKFGTTWDFKDMRYYLVCPKCGHSGRAATWDHYTRIYKDIRIVRWEPEYVDIDYNPVTTKRRYSYRIPPDIVAKIRQKDPNYLAEMPTAFIEAVRVNRPAQLVESNLFHFRAPTPSVSSARGWGFPPILAALKDSYYLQIMKKAQEAVMLEHLVPLDILFPSSSSPNADPYLHTNLAQWKREVEDALARWRLDPNYKPVMPVPTGVQRVGGDGRALMLTQEIRAMSEHILVGIGVPQEFVFGGLSWTGSSVSIRMLENTFLADRAMHERFLLHFVVPIVSMYMRWTPVKVHMQQFRMADDVQAKQLLMNLKQMGEISSKTLLAEFDKNAAEEQDLIDAELRRRLNREKLQQLAMADIQMEVAERQQARAAAKAKEQQVKTSSRDPDGVNVVHIAEGWARRLQTMPEQQRAAAMQRMEAEMPQMAQLVQAYGLGAPPTPGTGAGPQKPAGKNVVDMRPLPEKRPPRRAAAVI